MIKPNYEFLIEDLIKELKKRKIGKIKQSCDEYSIEIIIK